MAPLPALKPPNITVADVQRKTGCSLAYLARSLRITDNRLRRWRDGGGDDVARWALAGLLERERLNRLRREGRARRRAASTADPHVDRSVESVEEDGFM